MDPLGFRRAGNCLNRKSPWVSPAKPTNKRHPTQARRRTELHPPVVVPALVIWPYILLNLEEETYQCSNRYSSVASDLGDVGKWLEMTRSHAAEQLLNLFASAWTSRKCLAESFRLHYNRDKACCFVVGTEGIESLYSPYSCPTRNQ